MEQPKEDTEKSPLVPKTQVMKYLEQVLPSGHGV